MKSYTIVLAAALGLSLTACGADDGTGSTTDDCTQTNFDLQWFPQSEADWDVVPIIDAYQAETPSWAVEAIQGASAQDLRAGVSVSYSQHVEELPGGGARKMSVHITRLVVDLPFAEVVARLPVEDWGINLAHYLGGQVKIYQQDDEGRATRQLERMVLSPFPCDFNSMLTNNDMTKVEVIEYEADRATVYWRVMHSDNNSTEADLGTLEYLALEEQHTALTFQSAHRINALGGIHVPSAIVMPALESTFLDHLRRYADLLGS